MKQESCYFYELMTFLVVAIDGPTVLRAAAVKPRPVESMGRAQRKNFAQWISDISTNRYAHMTV